MFYLCIHLRVECATLNSKFEHDWKKRRENPFEILPPSTRMQRKLKYRENGSFPRKPDSSLPNCNARETFLREAIFSELFRSENIYFFVALSQNFVCLQRKSNNILQYLLILFCSKLIWKTYNLCVHFLYPKSDLFDGNRKRIWPWNWTLLQRRDINSGHVEII